MARMGMTRRTGSEPDGLGQLHLAVALALTTFILTVIIGGI